MRIQFDPTNLLAAMVGEDHGLTPAEVNNARAKALAALPGYRAVLDEGKVGGFPPLPFDAATAKSIEAYAKSVKGDYDTVCVVGIGGSALGVWALDCGVRGPHPVQGNFSSKFPRVVILDNIDPDFVASALASMTPKKTLVVVIAKSGNTAETLSTFLIVKEWMEKSLGRKTAKRIVAVTSANRGELKVLADREKYVTFIIPDNVGGRFSVLSPVGLVPAALAGLDIRKLLKGAAEMTKLCWSEDLDENIALNSALYHYLVWTTRNKSIQVAFPYSNRLWGMAFWFRQLWAESLGKALDRNKIHVNLGQTPVAALGTTDQHSQVQLYMEGPNDKVFTFWNVTKHASVGKIPKEKLGGKCFDLLAGQSLEKLLDAERRSTEAALTASQRPNCSFTLDKVDEEHLGAFIQMLQFQTAFMGEMLDINAFDQEGVELGKKFTFGLMGDKDRAEYADQFNAYEKKRKAAR